MTRRILALSEGLGVSVEALAYADALARRVEGTLVLLLLLPLDLDRARDADALGREGHELLRRRLEELGVDEPAVERHVRAGDPWSELCKFAALNGPFHLAVWVGEPGPADGRASSSGGSWISRIQEGLSCPVVTAQRRQGARRDEAERGGAKRR